VTRPKVRIKTLIPGEEVGEAFVSLLKRVKNEKELQLRAGTPRLTREDIWASLEFQMASAPNGLGLKGTWFMDDWYAIFFGPDTDPHLSFGGVTFGGSFKRDLKDVYHHWEGHINVNLEWSVMKDNAFYRWSK
jgi:hypothetical protein